MIENCKGTTHSSSKVHWPVSKDCPVSFHEMTMGCLSHSCLWGHHCLLEKCLVRVYVSGSESINSNAVVHPWTVTARCISTYMCEGGTGGGRIWKCTQNKWAVGFWFVSKGEVWAHASCVLIQFPHLSSNGVYFHLTGSKDCLENYLLYVITLYCNSLIDCWFEFAE